MGVVTIDSDGSWLGFYADIAVIQPNLNNVTEEKSYKLVTDFKNSQTLNNQGKTFYGNFKR